MTADGRKHLRALVAAEIGDREDAALVTPVLRVMLQTALRDFERYYEPRHARARIRDHDLLQAHWTQKKAMAK